MELISPFFLFIFFPISALLFILLKTGKVQKQFLLIVSLFFIYLFGANKLYLILALLFMNYFGGILLSFLFTKRTRQAIISRVVYFTLILINLIVLISFKYIPSITNIFSSQIIKIIQETYIPLSIIHIERLQKTIFPIGLSFLTFSMVSYIVDIYSGKIEVEKNLLDFSLYVSFFPKFVAGPIERYQTFSKELRTVDSQVDDVFEGLIRFVEGVSKKVLIVSALSRFTTPIFTLDPKEWNFQITWMALFLYALQIYIDFDAYSDMAIGMARVFGIRLMENFNLPYLADSVQDFWQRWHISLSTWLRDYILMPLNFRFRKQQPKWLFSVLGILITFAISGIWHGNTMNFLVWGIYYGVLLSIESVIIKKQLLKIPDWIRQVGTFLTVMISWVFFRFTSLQESLLFLSKMFIPQKFNGNFYRSILEFYKPEVIITTFFAILISFGVFKKIKAMPIVKNDIGKIIYAFVVIVLLIFSIMRIYSGYQETFLYATF